MVWKNIETKAHLSLYCSLGYSCMLFFPVVKQYPVKSTNLNFSNIKNETDNSVLFGFNLFCVSEKISYRV